MSADLANRVISWGRRGRLKAILHGSGAVIILVVLGGVIYGSRDQFQTGGFSPDYLMLFLSFMLWLVGYLMFALGWTLVLRCIGSPVGWWTASRVWFLSQGLKYIPGTVFYAAGRVYLAQEAGVRAMPAALGLLLENLLPLATAIIVFLVLLPFGLVEALPSYFPAVALAALLVLLVSLPILMRKMFAAWPRAGNLTLDYKRLPALIAYYLLIWLVVGLACYLSFRALGGVLPVGLWQVLGIYAFSWAAGLVAVFAPGGVGVRDGMLVLLLSGVVPLPMAALGAMVVRVQTLAVEGILALLALKAWPDRSPLQEDKG